MKVPLHPKHPERICWGCDKYCPACDLRCGNGTERAQHPVELLGEDWFELEKQQSQDAGDQERFKESNDDHRKRQTT